MGLIQTHDLSHSLHVIVALERTILHPVMSYRPPRVGSTRVHGILPYRPREVDSARLIMSYSSSRADHTVDMLLSMMSLFHLMF